MEPHGSRRDEVDVLIIDIREDFTDGDGCTEAIRLARTLADEVDELRGKLDDVRRGIGCARGQRTTQYCAEAVARDEIIGKLLEMLRPGVEPVPPADPSTLADWNLWAAHHSPWLTKANCYRFALEIAGRKE